MKRKVRIAALLLTLCMVGSSIVACGTSEKNAESSAKASVSAEKTVAEKEEPLKVKFHIFGDYAAPEADNTVAKWLKENKSIEIDVEVAPLDKFEDKMNIMLASGEVPDTISFPTSNLSNQTVNKWGDTGLVIPMDDWIAKYPNMIQNQDPEYNKAVYANKKDGKMYMIPGNTNDCKELMMPNIGPFIREDWLAQVGMQAPKTPDELYAVLKAFRDKIPDVDGKKIIPMSIDFFRQFLLNAWTQNWFVLSDDKKSLTYQFMDPRIEEGLVFMNKLYREGLLDREMFTQQYDQMMAKMSSGRVGYSVRVHTDMDKANATLKAKDPKQRFVPASPIRVPDAGYMPIYQNYTPNACNGLAISSKFAKDSRNLERLFEYLNWNASVEGASVLRYGPDGVYYTKNADGLLEMKPDVRAEIEKANSIFGAKSGIGVNGSNYLGFYNLLNFQEVPRASANTRTEESRMADVWKEAWGEVPMEYNLVQAGPVEQQKWGLMWSELDKWSAKAVTAKSEEECRKTVKEMLKAYETNGGRDIVNERLKSIADLAATMK